MCVLTTVKLHCVTALISFFRFVYNHFHPHAKSWWNKKYFHFFFYFSKTLSLIFLCKIERILLKPLFFSYLLWKKIFFFSSPKYSLFTAYNQIIYPFDITFLMKSKKKKKPKSLALYFLLKIQIICRCYILYCLNQHAIFIVILTIFWSMYLLAFFGCQSSSSVTFLEFQTEQFIFHPYV